MRIGIVDLLGKEPPKNGYSRLMRANNTSIMPQAIAVWCEEAGHEVHVAYHSGPDLLAGGLPPGAGPRLHPRLLAVRPPRLRLQRPLPRAGGAHRARRPARPFVSRRTRVRYFDYVVGFCDRAVLRDILKDRAPPPPARRLPLRRAPARRAPGAAAAVEVPRSPPWSAAKVLRLVPLLGSLGCPYKCSFCIDATVPYQPLGYDGLKDDLLFFQELALPRSVAVWHDPNFGIRFDEYLDAIEEVVPPGADHLRRRDVARRCSRRRTSSACSATASRRSRRGSSRGSTSGDKSRMRSVTGMEKVEQVAEQANLVNRYIPYTQCNLIFGLDADHGAGAVRAHQALRGPRPRSVPALRRCSPPSAATPS
jgi:hypothetical protein